MLSLLRHSCSAFVPISTRRAVLHALCCFDVLSLKVESSNARHELLKSDTTIALVSVVACEVAGRIYLSKGTAQTVLIPGLIAHLGSGNNTELQALVALQRLSLLKSVQDAMVCSNLLIWIVGELKTFVVGKRWEMLRARKLKQEAEGVEAGNFMDDNDGLDEEFLLLAEKVLHRMILPAV